MQQAPTSSLCSTRLWEMSNLEVCYEILPVGYSNQKAEEMNLDVVLNNKSSKESGVESQEHDFTTCKCVLILFFATWAEDRPT